MRRFYGDDSCSFTVTGFDGEELANLVRVLGEMGLSVECKTSSTGKSARLSFTGLPSAVDARTSRTRNAGRYHKRIELPNGSVFNNETTCGEFLDWLESHTHDEAMEQLGLARTTYFRRLKRIRERAKEQDRINAARANNPIWSGNPPEARLLLVES